MSKIARSGLIIGKFMPLTKGHCYLIETALAQVEQLNILVGTLRNEPIDGHLRYEWVRETFPQASVVHVTEELPAYPHEHPDFWAIWQRAIRDVFPQVDVVFTSEDYGDKLAEVLGARHIQVDKARSVVPISATQVRAEPLRHWAYIPRAVRPYYVKRVLIHGAESTGKTTLARQLAAHYGTQWVPEYGRIYIEQQRGNRFDDFVYEDIAQIAAGHLESEEAAAYEANRLLFVDTDLMTTAIYSEHFFGQTPRFVRRIANERRYDLYLLLDIDLPWADDPQRTSRDHWQAMHCRFRNALESRRIPYTLIQGQGEARLQNAIAAVEVFLTQT